MNSGLVLCVACAAIWSAATLSNNETLVSMLMVNAGLQIALFIVVACIPYIKTGRMSYVDIAWPFGVALIGVQIILMGDGDMVRRVVTGSAYLLIGLRMGIGGLAMARKTGVIFKTEFPRYEYRHMLLKQSGVKNIKLHGLAEMMAQGFSNASALAFPGFMLAVNTSGAMSAWEIVGLSLWLVAYLLETTADGQKLLFVSKKENEGGVCDVGLWKFSRHPNYFAEWLVWTGLVIAAVPSWIALNDTESTFVWAVLGLGATGASSMLYLTLVHLTGAVPAEYFSVKKRPEYEAYQRRTNMFFPWFPRPDANGQNKS